MLFIPANKAKYVESALSVRPAPDAVIIDLEDGAPTGEREGARGLMTAEATALSARYPVFVRVNAHGSKWFEDDVGEAVKAGAAAVVSPKAEPEGVEELARLLDALGSRAGAIPLIESAGGVVHAHAVAAGRRVMAVGSGPGDYAMDLGLAWSKEGLEYYYGRSKIPTDAAAAGVPALDGPYMDLEGLEGFRRDCSISRRLGYKGRQVVHPSQVGPANEAYGPSPQEAEWAGEVARAYEEAAAAGAGAIRVRGQLVDRMNYKMAPRILEEDGEARARGGA